MENSKVTNATGALVIMHSVDREPNPQVPIDQPILNFPPTPDAVSQKTGTLPFPRFSG